MEDTISGQLTKNSSMLTKKEEKFWTNPKIVGYFAAMSADPFIIDRLESVPNPLSMKALDLGCGGGRHTEMLSKFGFEIYACDVSLEMLGYTKQRLSKNRSESKSTPIIKFGSMLNIPFGDSEFDVIISTGVLHQAKSYSEYEQAVREVSRVAKSGCILCLDIFTNKVWDDTYTKVSGENYTVITKEGLYMTLLDKNTFYKLLSDHGFVLQNELPEEIINENTGKRVVLRANFVKN